MPKPSSSCHCEHHAPEAGVAAPPLAAVSGAQEAVFRIDQMDCPTEERLLRKALEQLEGVRSLSFNLMERTLRVGHVLDDPQPIAAAIAGLDMSPVLLNPGEPADANVPAPPAVSRATWIRMATAGVFAIGSEILAYSSGQETSWPVAALALCAIVLGGTDTLRKGWLALRHFTLNINLLMTVAVIGAVLIGQWPEAAVVIWLFGIAEMIEAMSLDRARNAIRSLTALAPEQALLQQPDASWLEVPARAIAIGAVIRARPGERIALDGVVVRGESSIDQAPITGESMPVDKHAGDTVFAGTINQQGVLEYRVTASTGHTMLDRIAHSVQEAQGQRAPTQRFIDTFARVYTPVVFAIAVVVAIAAPLLLGQPWTDWVYRALVLLVIACPCALVISTPVTIVSALTAAARKGILVKGGLYLEQGHRLGVIALDKTGTLTHGKPVLTDVLPFGAASLSPAEALHLAASLDALSSHPVAQAISGASSAHAQVENFQALPGRGVTGDIDGGTYYLGNLRLMQEIGVAGAELEAALGTLEKQGKTAVVLSRQGTALAVLAVADAIRDSSRAAVAELRQLGISSVILSGDNAETVQAIARQLGITDARGNLLPEEKLAAIDELSLHAKTGMVGDGVNDAPALARAHIGFAMGAAGTDTAIETADVALMQDDLRKLPEFIRLSYRTRRVLWQNIIFALAIKLVFFALTFTGQATLWMAVFADAGASLLVVFNGLRLLR